MTCTPWVAKFHPLINKLFHVNIDAQWYKQKEKKKNGVNGI